MSVAALAASNAESRSFMLTVMMFEFLFPTDSKGEEHLCSNKLNKSEPK